MRLSEYLDNPEQPRGTAKRLAEALGIHKTALSQLVGGAAINPARCVVIEDFTDKQVRRWDLRPNDWFLIWPELVDLKGAPDVPQKAEA